MLNCTMDISNQGGHAFAYLLVESNERVVPIIWIPFGQYESTIQEDLVKVHKRERQAKRYVLKCVCRSTEVCKAPKISQHPPSEFTLGLALIADAKSEVA